MRKDSKLNDAIYCNLCHLVKNTQAKKMKNTINSVINDHIMVKFAQGQLMKRLFHFMEGQVEK